MNKIQLVIKGSLIIIMMLSLYTAFIAFSHYSHSRFSRAQLTYTEQRLALSSLWNNQQFLETDQKYPILNYQIDQQEEILKIKHNLKNSQKQAKINIHELGFEIQDVQQIKDILLINEEYKMALVESKYFKLVFSMNSKKICYHKVGIKNKQIFEVDDKGRLWIFTYPNNNVILLRVYDCETSRLVYLWKSVTPQKIQLINSIQNKKQIIQLKALTFDRSSLIYRFNFQTFALQSYHKQQAYSFQYFAKQITEFQINLSQKLKSQQTKIVLQQFLHLISFGYFGKLANQIIPTDEQLDFAFEAYDKANNFIIQVNKYVNKSSVVSLGQVLVPLRTPVFISKQDQSKLLPFDEILNKSKTDKNIPSISLKLYEIKTKRIQIIQGKVGIYRMLPDAKVHFLTFDSKYLSFYPNDNLNQQEYYLVRIPKGGLALKGSQIKGIFEDVSVPNPNSVSLKYGYSQQQVYHQQTTSGSEVAPGIYEIHAVHKGLFVSAKNNRVELITSLSGKSILTHYISVKNKYEYTTSYIENNEFWVFEHKPQSPPLITKYELFLNASSPKSILSIKRNYQFAIEGKITRVQKCIDYFYYFNYITDDSKYGIARIHHALMSNRQSREDGKYSGAFQSAMVIPNIKRNTQFNISIDEEELMTIQFNIDSKILSKWKQLQMKHQFKVLPIRIYSYKNQYFVFNIRKIMLTSYSMQINTVSQNVFFIIFISTVILFFTIVAGIITYSKKIKNIIKLNEQKSKNVKSKKQV